MQPANYYKKLDGLLWDFFEALGDTDLGDFNPDAGTYKGEAFELGEVPIAVLAEATGYTLAKGNGNTRLHQLDADGLITLRKTGRYKPSFVSLIEEDHAEYFRLAGLSRAYWGKLVNPDKLTAGSKPEAQPKTAPAETTGFNFADATDADRFSWLDGIAEPEARGKAFSAAIPRDWYHSDVESFSERYRAHRGVA